MSDWMIVSLTLLGLFFFSPIGFIILVIVAAKIEYSLQDPVMRRADTWERATVARLRHEREERKRNGIS